jgi:replicative DNA helicase
VELYNAEAEASVLAGMLRHPDAYWSINDVGLSSDDFIGTENRKVMRAILAVVGDKKQPDLPLVLEELRMDDGTLTVEYVGRLVVLPCSVAQAIEYARTVKGLATSRQLSAAGAAIIEVARENRADAERAMGEAESLLRRVRETLPAPERSPEPVDILRRIRQGGPKEFIVIRFLPTLQYLSGGLQPGHLWVVGGFSSTGKSALSVNFLTDIIHQNKSVLVVSPEMTQEQYIIRLMATMSGVPQRSIRDRLPGDLEQAESLKKTEMALTRARLKVFDYLYRMVDVRSQATRMQEMEGLDVLIIDFIQLLRGSTGDFAFGDMTEVTLDLQQLAKDLRCTVIAFSQVSNEMAKWDSQGGDDNYYAFKGSGSIKDAADFAIMLKRDRVRQSPSLDVHLVKNRHGELAVIPTHLDLPTGRIVELEVIEEDEG